MTRKELARHMVQVTKETFEMMIPIPLSIGKIAARPREDLVDCVSAIVGIAGSLSVLVDVCCSQEAALKISTALLEEDMLEINHEVLDAIGELANLLAGAMKGKLATQGGRLELTVPFVITGDRYTVKWPVNSVAVEVPFLLSGQSRFAFTVIVR